MSTIKPTIGRKVWLYVSTDVANKLGDVVHDRQPFDASITWVHPEPAADGTPLVNVAYFDHDGKPGHYHEVPLHDPKPTDSHMGGGNAYATWMPYQVGQASKVGAGA